MDQVRPPRWTRLASRYGTAALMIGMVPLVVIGVAVLTGLLEQLPEAMRRATTPITVVALPLLAFGMAAAQLPRPTTAEPRPLAAPVRGRVRALNSPADRVPSHGTHGFAQTYAIDLVHEPEPGARPTFGGREAMRDPRAYPSFGRPVHAPADGTVVRAVDGARDHRCRSNRLGLLLMALEGVAFQLRGARGLMGNHLILRLSDDTHVAIAHLQRGSLRVDVGDEVRCGDVVAAVGNSGNSSEPHVHLQLMDGPRPASAVALPFGFTDVVTDDDAPAAEPAERLTVPSAAHPVHAGVASEPR